MDLLGGGFFKGFMMGIGATILFLIYKDLLNKKQLKQAFLNGQKSVVGNLENKEVEEVEILSEEI